jgi:hypothetical protein
VEAPPDFRSLWMQRLVGGARNCAVRVTSFPIRSTQMTSGGTSVIHVPCLERARQLSPREDGCVAEADAAAAWENQALYHRAR